MLIKEKNTFEVIESNKIFVKEKKDQLKLTAKISLGVIRGNSIQLYIQRDDGGKQNSLLEVIYKKNKRKSVLSWLKQISYWKYKQRWS